MKVKYVLAVLLFITILIAGCKKPAVLKDFAKIVFVSNRSGSFEVYRIDDNGRNQRKLTNTPQSQEMFPDFSPDGKKIAYLSKTGNNTDIIVMNADGSFKKNLMPGSYEEIGFQFSRDSKKISFVSNKDGDFEIYVCDVDGRNIKKLTDNKIYDGGPAWSLDDRYIYWVSSENSKVGTEIYRMDADGHNKVRYTSNRLEEGVDSISFDGKWLAVSATRNNNWEILIFSSDGKKRFRFTKNKYYDAASLFAPKSYRLVWIAHPGKTWDILTSDLKTPYQASNLTKGSGENYSPSWSPEGKKIVFESNRTQHSQIYTMNIDGSGLKQITKGNFENLTPRWRPSAVPPP